MDGNEKFDFLYSNPGSRNVQHHERALISQQEPSVDLPEDTLNGNQNGQSKPNLPGSILVSNHAFKSNQALSHLHSIITIEISESSSIYGRRKNYIWSPQSSKPCPA
jgi:hypothetical protein